MRAEILLGTLLFLAATVPMPLGHAQIAIPPHRSDLQSSEAAAERIPHFGKSPEGLLYRSLGNSVSCHKHPNRSDTIVVRYEGRFADGTIFDSSWKRHKIDRFSLKHVIPGWVGAASLMCPGEIWEFIMPPSLAYGARGWSSDERDVPSIPPGSTLTFRIELISFQPTIEH